MRGSVRPKSLKKCMKVVIIEISVEETCTCMDIFWNFTLHVLAVEGQSLNYPMDMLLTCTLYSDARPSCLIRAIRSVCWPDCLQL